MRSKSTTTLHSPKIKNYPAIKLSDYMPNKMLELAKTEIADLVYVKKGMKDEISLKVRTSD